VTIEDIFPTIISNREPSLRCEGNKSGVEGGAEVKIFKNKLPRRIQYD
jgi:hypothetical protein